MDRVVLKPDSKTYIVQNLVAYELNGKKGTFNKERVSDNSYSVWSCREVTQWLASSLLIYKQYGDGLL